MMGKGVFFGKTVFPPWKWIQKCIQKHLNNLGSMVQNLQDWITQFKRVRLSLYWSCRLLNWCQQCGAQLKLTDRGKAVQTFSWLHTHLSLLSKIFVVLVLKQLFAQNSFIASVVHITLRFYSGLVWTVECPSASPYFLWLRTLITISKISTTTGVTYSSLSGGLCHIYTELRFGTTEYWKISLLQTLLKLRWVIVAKKVNIFSSFSC